MPVEYQYVRIPGTSQPLVIAGIEPRTVQKVAPVSVDQVILRNIGRGPALYIQVNDVTSYEDTRIRSVIKAKVVDCIEAGKEAEVDFTFRLESAEEVHNKSTDSLGYPINPSYLTRTYNVVLSYEDINGQKHESILRMGNDGVRLLRHGKVKAG